MNKFIKIIRGCKNRLIFSWTKKQLKSVGKKTLIEAPYTIYGEKYISIGDHVRIKPRLQMEAIDFHNKVSFSPQIIIGDNVSINYDVHIACANKVTLGNNVLIASKVFITDHYHGMITKEMLDTPPSKRNLFSKGPVIIEENVWLGEGSVVLPNVVIGKNSIIGANSVVTKDVPENCVAAGAPARVIRYLKRE